MVWADNLTYHTANGRTLNVKYNIRSSALEIANAAEKAGHNVIRVIGATDWPDHNSLRCLDFVGDKDMQAWVVAYVLKNKDRLGLELMINQRRMYRTYAKTNLRSHKGKLIGSYVANTWSPYGPLSGGDWIGTSNPHTDHVHCQFYEKSYVAPPVSKPVASKPSTSAPADSDVPGWWHVTADRLNGRSKPSTSASIRFVRSKGFNVYAVKAVKSGGMWWLTTKYGTNYAKQYLSPGKVK